MAIEDQKRILIVDDEPGILKVLSIHLRHRGYAVTTSTSGREAIKLAREQAPDLLLVDILMPEVTGLDVLQQVRSFSRAPVIVFSANPRVISIAMAAGANGAISKPFDPDTLENKIRDVMNSQKRV
jgi:CheY-like chemotaxis protein